MGKVYAAVVDARVPGLGVGTRVALKVVHSHLLETPGFFKRFLREGEIGKSVRHENVVATFDCDQLLVDGAHHSFLSMEYVEGQTLRELLDELERVPEELCRHIAREVCKGLSAIHAAGVIHRDMKPDNVLITEDHVVKVMDLGVARLQDEQLRLSQTGAFVGSIHYAAPECFQKGGADVDHRADLHALGLVLYELACGTNPYEADTVPAILKRVLHEEPRRLGDANPQLSAFFEEVVHNLLAKSPDDRFASADELLAVLEDGENSAWWHRRASMIRATTKRPIRRIRIPRETAVYGREDELAKLRALYDAAKLGEGCVVLIERSRIRAGFGLVSEDRKGEGLAQVRSVADNVTYSRLAPYARFGWLRHSRRTSAVSGWLGKLQVKARGPSQPVIELSGGNQQKVALARVLHQEADILLLDEPTRGIDVATKAEIYRLIGEQAAAGKAVLFVSSYFPELLAVCDRVAVMSRGRLRDVRPAREWTEESILSCAIGTDA